MGENAVEISKKKSQLNEEDEKTKKAMLLSVGARRRGSKLIAKLKINGDDSEESQQKKMYWLFYLFLKNAKL